jgi:sugar phosphate isomerase/epimerase
MKLGYNTWSMPTLTFEEAVRHCAQIGYDTVELTVSEGWPTDVLGLAPGAPDEWRAIAADAGIPITSLTANTPVIVAKTEWPESRDRLVRSMELAAALGSEGQRMPISLGASLPMSPTGSRHPDSSANLWDEHRSLIVERFGELAELAQEIGVRVALEPHVAAVVSRIDRALFVLDEVGIDSLGLNLDISHFAVQGVPTAEAVRALAPRAFVSEVKDQRGVEPDFDFLIPGEGDFDYVEFLREMKAAGYEGSVSVEVSVFRQRIAGYDPYEAAVSSYAVLAPAFAEAGIERPLRSAQERAGH